MALAPPPPPRHRARHTLPARATAAVVGALVLAAGIAVPSAAQSDDAPEPDVPSAGSEVSIAVFDLPDPVQDPFPLAEGDAVAGARSLLPESVRDVPVTSSAITRTEGELAALESTILQSRAQRNQALADIGRLTQERQAGRARYSSLRDRRRASSLEADAVRNELAQLAVAAYVGAGNPGPAFELDPVSATESGRQRAIVDAVDTTLRERLAAAEADAAAAGLAADAVREELTLVAGQIDAAERRLVEATSRLAIAEPDLPRTQERYRDQFMLAQVQGADFTVVALDAYRTAAEQIAVERPGCRLEWSILAGIGRVESRHGTYGGATLRVDGTTSRRILGIALDGSPGIMLIPDTDGGALDGDSVFDRAVGPMQFIPSTWRMVRRDGNGNGRMDPHNMYDAALAAAVYLCRGGERLDQAAALNRAILTYNRSQPYVNTVLGHHRSYQRLQLP